MTGSTYDQSDNRPTPLVPIQDEASYEAALAEVEALWYAPAGSSEDARLQALVLLIEAYEQEHYPIEPPEPSDALRFRIEQQQLTVAEVAALLELSEQRVCALLDGA